MKVLSFDIETHGKELLWDMPREEFFRLGGYAWGDGDVALTDDVDELASIIRSADLIVGHNIHAFDLIAVFGKDSVEPLRLSRQNRVFDTWTHATLAFPAPSEYENREGKIRKVIKPPQAMKWYALDNMAYQLGVDGKSYDLKELAKEFGGFGEIPTTDQRYRDYLVQDVVATRTIARRLWQLLPFQGYAVREQMNAAIDAQNSRNGWRTDQAAAQARVDELEERKKTYLSMLSTTYGLPIESAAPLRTTAGKEAVAEALKAVGIKLSALPKTKGGQPSFGGDGLIAAAEGKGDEAVELASVIAAIGGMRPLAQSALDHTHSDGKVHPSITTLQLSGRKSTTDPGLTVWTSRGAGAVEKAYFVPNELDEVLVAFDYSQADGRIVAAYSGDRKFAKRFAEGADAHLLTAWAVWGQDVVGTDRNDQKTEDYRQIAKALGHAYAYRAGARRLSLTSGQPLAVAKRFVEAMQAAYPGVTAWQDRVTREGAFGSVTNAWGRTMQVQRGREWTQAPALYGQSGTREIMVDALIRMPDRILQMLVAQVHDELIFSIPALTVESDTKIIKDAMECYWQPPDGTGQRVHFPVEVGKPAKNWEEAGH